MLLPEKVQTMIVDRGEDWDDRKKRNGKEGKGKGKGYLGDTNRISELVCHFMA